MKDVKMDNLELFYDVMTDSCEILYEATKKNYFDLIEESAKNILEGEIVSDIDDEYIKRLSPIYEKLEGIDFSLEDVRKAMQSVILRGFKENNMPNGYTTPDTIGIFFTYLISKLTNKDELNIIDPLCGVSNLLFTISNYFDKKLNLFACDNDSLMIRMTKVLSDLMNINTEIFYQDALSLNINNMDLVIADMPNCILENNKFFPYEAILHFCSFLNDNGAIILMIQNDFFDYDKNQEFKKELLSKVSLVGLCELPDNMFALGKPKSILVLQKKEIKDKCFMVKLPSFTDVKEFNESLLSIEEWFEKNK